MLSFLKLVKSVFHVILVVFFVNRNYSIAFFCLDYSDLILAERFQSNSLTGEFTVQDSFSLSKKKNN